MTLAARVVQASMITPRRSYRTRSRRRPFSQLIVRSTTQRTLPSPLPLGVRAWRCVPSSIPRHPQQRASSPRSRPPLSAYRSSGDSLSRTPRRAWPREVEYHRDDALVVAGVGPSPADGQRHAGPTEPGRAARAGFPAVERAASQSPRRPRRPTPVTPSTMAVSRVELTGPLPGAAREGLACEPIPDALASSSPRAEAGDGAATPGASELGRDALPAVAGGQDEPDHPLEGPMAGREPAALPRPDGLLGEGGDGRGCRRTRPASERAGRWR